MASSVALPGDSNRHGRIYESRPTPDALKASAFTPRGYFSLNPRATAKTIPEWRENIFSHRAIKTPSVAEFVVHSAEEERGRERERALRARQAAFNSQCLETP